MTVKVLSEELEAEIRAARPLRQIIETLRNLRRIGVSREEVLESLRSLRDRALDGATEDRILEVMDVVSGFCSRENSVWEDE